MAPKRVLKLKRARTLARAAPKRARCRTEKRSLVAALGHPVKFGRKSKGEGIDWDSPAVQELLWSYIAAGAGTRGRGSMNLVEAATDLTEKTGVVISWTTVHRRLKAMRD